MIPDKIVVYRLNQLSLILTDFFIDLTQYGFSVPYPNVSVNRSFPDIYTIDFIKKEVSIGFDEDYLKEKYGRHYPLMDGEISRLSSIRYNHLDKYFEKFDRLVYQIPTDWIIIYELITENNKTIKKNRFQFIDFNINTTNL